MAKRPGFSMPLTAVLVFSCSASVAACDKAEIEGVVVDGITKKPIPDVAVGVVGTTFQASTDQSGRYSIGYVPGQVSVTFAKPGYTESGFGANLATESTYPAAATSLYRIPEEQGIWIVDPRSGEYIPAAGADICSEQQRSMVGYGFQTDLTFTATDIDPETKSVPPGKVVILDNSSENLELVAVSPGGILLRRRIDATLNVRDDVTRHSEKERLDVGKGVQIRSYELDEGVYAFIHIEQRGNSFIGAARDDLVGHGGYQIVVGRPTINSPPSSCVLGD